jgi:hypothetical protein
MTAKSFKRLCKFYRNAERKPWSFRFLRNVFEDHCKKCKGKYPPELTIIKDNGMIEEKS